MSAPEQREWGEQPLHHWMDQRGVNNAQLVACSTEFLTHKQVARARRGRWLTPAMRLKILRAARTWQSREEPDAPVLQEADLFGYAHPLPPIADV